MNFQKSIHSVITKILQESKKKSEKFFQLVEEKKRELNKMASSIFVTFTIAIVFGVNLIVSGIPVDKIEATPEIDVDNENVTGNGTHKEL